MISADKPILSSKEDSLGRTTFSQSLAKSIIENNLENGFTIGLYGKWGSGKTSTLNMIVEEIKAINEKNKREIVILRFNPWLCTNPEQLVSQFFKQLLVVLKKKEIAREVYQAIEKYAGALEFASVVPVYGPFVAILGRFVQGFAGKSLQNMQKDLQTLKDEITKSLNSKKIRLFVTIDDIDRLSKDEIKSVFQLVKSVADFPNTVYLLAFDRDVVVEALSDVQNGNGAEYLEKIVQIPFEMPETSDEKIDQFLFNKLTSILRNNSEENWDKDKWYYLYYSGMKHYFKSIRDANRFVNTFLLKFELLKNETDPLDLLALTCLQVFEPNVYSKISGYREELCGDLLVESIENYGTETEKIAKIFEILISGKEDEFNKKAIAGILTLVFPKLCYSINHSYSVYSKNRFEYYPTLHRGNVSNKECFFRYFKLSIEEEALSLSYINPMLFEYDEIELKNKILEINQNKKANRLLDHIRGAFMPLKGRSEFSGRAKLILKIYTEIWPEIKDSKKDEFLFTPIDWSYVHIIRNLLEVLDEMDRKNFIIQIFNDSSIDLHPLHLQLEFFEEQHGRFTDVDRKEENQLFDLETVLRLEKIFLNRVKNEADSGKLIDNAHFSYIKFFWLKMEKETHDRYVLKLVESDNTFTKLIGNSVGHGKLGDIDVTKFWAVDPSLILGYLSINEAYKRLNRYIHTKKFSEISSELKDNIIAILVFIEKWPEEKVKSREKLIYKSDIEKKLNSIQNQ